MRLRVEARLDHRQIQQLLRHPAPPQLLEDHRLVLPLAREIRRELPALLTGEAGDVVVDALVREQRERAALAGDALRQR